MLVLACTELLVRSGTLTDHPQDVSSVLRSVHHSEQEEADGDFCSGDGPHKEDGADERPVGDFRIVLSEYWIIGVASDTVFNLFHHAYIHHYGASLFTES